MSLNPLKTTVEIRDNYLRYLKTTFPIRNAELAAQFDGLLHEENRLLKGPILEVTPPYQTGTSIEDLIQDGVLSERFRRLCNKHLPLHRPLYRHQEQAIRKVVSGGRNIVVATGTGSGKTETFLIPVINHLLREADAGQLGGGIRALLLYPMNALANDQVKRMRLIFRQFPQITFGRYTGETKETAGEAKDHFSRHFPNEPDIPNELLSREEMRRTPPHIFLTNYAMLEYLLLRPKDCVFFDGEYAQYWKFLVLDEAHTYDGAKGIETAMLLRRLKDRLVKSETVRIRCIATSATLGRGREDFPRIVGFAGQLFSERFEWDDFAPDRQDVVEASRLSLYEEQQTQVPLPVSSYREWRECDDVFLYEALQKDSRLNRLRGLLEEKPRFFHEMTQEIFPELPADDAHKALHTLIELAVRARPDDQSAALLPARYHLFVRALEGAYLRCAPTYRLLLQRSTCEKVEGTEYAVFEIATCRRCGHLYFVGKETETGLLRQSGAYEDVGFYLLQSSEQASEPEDEDQAVLAGDEEAESQEADYRLCPQCGRIGRSDSSREFCECYENQAQYLPLRKVKAKDQQVRHCPACGSKTSGSSLVRRFLTGQDAPVTVLATALYQQFSETPHVTPDFENFDDDWGAIVNPEFQAKTKGVNRQLLLFSDSRQDAAFFACFLDRTYQQILRRRLILHTLEQQKEDVLRNRWRVQDLVQPLRLEAQKLHIFEAGASLQEQERLVWIWLLRELFAFDRRNSLEGLGLLGFALLRPEGWKPPKPLLQPPWNLTETEVWHLYRILLDSFRLQSALTFPDAVDPKDEMFQPRNYAFYFREQVANGKRHIFSWGNPGKGKLNRRLDFLLKLAASCSPNICYEECHLLLNMIWARGFNLNSPRSCWNPSFEKTTLRGEGVVYRLRHDMWELQPGTLSAEIPWQQCDTCGNLFLQNVRGMCPTYRCQGRLQPCQPDEMFRGNHYRNLYQTLTPSPMVSEEHTAQLTGEAAAELQERFIRGDVNVLSCSTTFELGVDVGDLETVLMRNVPPSPANYIQRAGRAGRRTDSTAFAVTFCQRRSHDLTHFNEPERMVSGKIQAPYFELANERILRRHLHAVVLARFWKEYSQYFGRSGRIEDFFFPSEQSGPEELLRFVSTRPDSLTEALSRIVPNALHETLRIQDWGWIDALMGDSGSLTKAAHEIRHDVQTLEQVHKDLSRKQQPADYILRTINTLYRKNLIGCLSSRNVLPKYGFPVDLVEFHLMHHGYAARRLELNRSLQIAISEYAPESEVVAGGYVWVSYGLKRLPSQEWLEYAYAVCPACGHYQKVLKHTRQSLRHCRACGCSLNKKGAKGTFVIPEFGFVTDNKPPKRPGDSRPRRTYASHAYFSDDEHSKAEQACFLEMGHIRFQATPYREGLLTVLNRTGFNICFTCGFAIRSTHKPPSSHQTSWGTTCSGKRLSPPKSLGHEFRTDVVDLRFTGMPKQQEFLRFSLLYALLEGLSEALDISRNDIDGCLFDDQQGQQAFILYDTVPGGAGHVKRVAQKPEHLREMLHTALNKVSGQCGCGPDTSCYGCLRSYRNQFCHDKLVRGSVKEFLEKVLQTSL